MTIVNKREAKARRRLARLYMSKASMYADASSLTFKKYTAACFAELAAMYRRAAIAITVLSTFRGVDLYGVAWLLRESGK